MPDPGQSDKLTALQQLSQNIPVANSQIAQQQKAARDLQLQQAVAAAPAAATAGQAQQVGAQAAQNAGQQTIQAEQTATNQQEQVASAANTQQQQDIGQTVTGLQQGTEATRQQQIQQLADFSETAKQQMFDDRLKFQTDEQNRAFMNQRQLADYAKLKAQSDQDFQNYAENASEVSQAKIEVLQTMSQRLEQSMKNDFTRQQEGLDKLTDQQIYDMQRDVNLQIQAAKNQAANTTAAWGAVGTIAGAVVGGVVGGPAGAKMGGAVGGLGGTAEGQGQSQGGLNSGYAGATQTAGGT